MAITKYLQSSTGIIDVRTLGCQLTDITIDGVGPTTVEYALWDLYQRTGTGAISPLVHKDGAETLTGPKTFTQNVTVGNTGTSYTLIKTDGSLELYPTSSAGNGGYIDFHYNGSGSDYTSRIIESANGILSAKTNPGASSATNNDNIVTVGYMNDPTKALNVVHRTGNETLAGNKTLTGTTKFSNGSNGGTTISTTSGNVTTIQHYNTSGTANKKLEFTSDGHLLTETPSVSSTSALDVTNVAWVNDPSVSNTNIVHRTGNETIDGVKTFVQEINGTSLRAKWADLAEVYATDIDYPVGTLVQFGGSKEMIIATSEVNGVISSNPALLMNGAEEGQPIAMVGRVPVRVKGPISKFDYIGLSDEPGVATRVEKGSENIIGRALEESSTEYGLVLCSVRFQL